MTRSNSYNYPHSIRGDESGCGLASFVRVRRLDGMELTIDLADLEDAMEGSWPGEYYLLPDSGRVVFFDDDADDGNGEQSAIEQGADALPIDPIESRTRCEWMEKFMDSAHSITAQNSLQTSLRRECGHGHIDMNVNRLLPPIRIG